MLRILVISLVVANLLLLGFQDNEPETQPEPAVSRAVERDSGIPTIHLFSEMMQDQGLLSGSRQCFSLGPFHTVEDKDETRSRLMAVSTNISERQTEALVEKGYWVFMPPYGSLLEANKALLSLQALGLDDIAITYDGKWKNAISLGYFMRHGNALRRQESLQERGYEPSIRVQRQAESRYWLDYEQTPGSGLITLDMQNRPNDFMQRALPCPQQDLFDIVQPESQQVVQAAARLQAIDQEAVAAQDQSEDSSTAEEIESTTVEAVEALPEAAGEAGSESGIGIETEGDLDPELESTIETGPVDDAGTTLESAIETGSEGDTGMIPEGALETAPEGDAEAIQEGAIETESDGGAGTDPESVIETDSETDTETIPEGASGTGPEYPVGTGSDSPAATEQESVDDTESGEG